MRNIRLQRRVEQRAGKTGRARPRNWINFQQVESPGFSAAAGGGKPGTNLNADVGTFGQSGVEGEWGTAVISRTARTRQMTSIPID